MQGEALVLPGQIAFAPMIIQAGFADGHHFGPGSAFQQFFQAEFFGFWVVGVDADCGVDVGVILGDGVHFFEALPAHADGDGFIHAGLGHVGEDFR